MENKNNNLQELEELRSQVAEFKNRMEQQEIVNRRLLDTAMKGHVSWIKQMNIWADIIGLILTPLVIVILRGHYGCPWGPIVLFVLLLVGETVFNVWNVNSIHNKHLLCGDVLSMQQRLITFKRREKIQTVIEVPLLVVCLIWFFFASNSTLYFIGACVVGLAFGAFIYYREMRSLNNAIKDINEFAGKE